MGGPAHQAALLSGRLDPERFETLLVHGSLAKGEETMAGVLEREGVEGRFLPALAPPVRPISDIRALAALARIVRDFRPHIVHTHTAKAGFLGRRAALLAGQPRPALVHTYHGHVLEGYFGPAKTRAYRVAEWWAARSTGRLVGVSQATVDDLVRLGVAPRERFQVIPLGLDLTPYAASDPQARAQVHRELDIADGDVVVGFAGRMVPIKRLDVLLRAGAVTIRGGAPLVLALAGDGELRADHERLAAELGIAGRVRFLGYRADLPRLFAGADIAAVSSDNEGTPVSLIEAGAAGLPAVATDVGGVSEVITPESGVLVPSGDHEAMARALAELAGDADLRERMGAAARAHVMSSYSVERLVSDVEGLYGDLVPAQDS